MQLTSKFLLLLSCNVTSGNIQTETLPVPFIQSFNTHLSKLCPIRYTHIYYTEWRTKALNVDLENNFLLKLSAQ